MATIRQRICDAILTTLRGVAGVGDVLDAAAADDSSIAATVAGDPSAATPVPGAHACELVFGDDTEPPDRATIGKSDWDFPVVVITHLKTDLGGLLPYQAAQEIHGAIVKAFAADPSAGGLAIDILPTGGGGVALDEVLLTRQTFSGFTVKYRHAFGDPEAP
jgi:hypothetical protein